jgi:hypothetical protein
MFYYISYTWLKLTFGKEVQENLEMVPSRALGATYLPAYLAISPQPKYSAYFSASSKKLSSYLLSKCFLEFKNNLRNIKQFKQKRANNLLSKILCSWSSYSTHKLIQTSKLTKFTEAHKKKLTSNLFSELKAYLTHKISLKRRRNFIEERQEKATICKFMNFWRVSYKRSVVGKHQEAVADHM